MLAMVGAIALFILWAKHSEEKYEKLDQEKKKRSDERKGIIFSIVILAFILLVVWATLSTIFD